MKYNRILLKLSGESLGAGEGRGIDTDRLNSYAKQIAAAASKGVQICLLYTSDAADEL